MIIVNSKDHVVDAESSLFLQIRISKYSQLLSELTLLDKDACEWIVDLNNLSVFISQQIKIRDALAIRQDEGLGWACEGTVKICV